MPQKAFTHLHVHSHYSLLDGLSKLDGLVERAAELEMDSLALTDHGVLYGAVPFYQKAKAEGIKPIIGMEAYVAPGSRFEKNAASRYHHLTLLAKNFTGYQNLIKLTTKGYLEGFYYKPRIDKELLREHSTGLVALSGCLTGEIPRLLAAGNKEGAGLALEEYLDIFGKENFFLEIQRHPKLKPGEGSWEPIESLLLELSKKKKVRLAATNDVHYLKPEDCEAQEVLLGVQTGGKFNGEDRLTFKGADLSLKSAGEMYELFNDLPEALESTREIAERADLALPLDTVHLPPFPLPEGKTADEELARLAHAGLKTRFGDNPPAEVRERLAYELEVIRKTRFASYFLIVHDIISWAKEHGISRNVRGSAIGSLVSYLLGITDINPLQYGLLFERFMTAERIQMPDIDIDFTDTRRDEVINYVREKYGQDRVAQIITFGTMAARASVRDVTRALGLHWSFADEIAKLIPFGMSLGRAIKEVGELREALRRDRGVRRVITVAMKLEGVARHASTHAAGIIITDKPLTEYVPLQFDPKERHLITQYDMYAIDDLGLLKIDFLGLKNLRLIEETTELVKARHDTPLDPKTLPLEDPKAFELLKRAETIGIFQLESSGMRRYLKELEPSGLEDIVAMVALYRPGPMELIPRYIARKHGKERVSYLHHKLKPILEPTYGIGIYQEQMMKIAQDLAGYTLSEADMLRKAIGKKIKSLLDKQREKLISGMLKNGIERRTAERIWELFPPFARYGFNRSHAVGYALIAYQTAYLKAHFPAEFMTNLLNVEAGDVERTAFLIDEARRLGFSVLPPDINESGRFFTLASDSEIRFGFEAIKNVGSNTVAAILRERLSSGPFAGLEDFLERVEARELNRKTLEAMARVGVFDRWEERGKLLANLDYLLSYARRAREVRSNHTQTLFVSSDSLKEMLKMEDAPPAGREERMRWEKELLGLYLSEHPLTSLWERIKEAVTPIMEIGEGMVGYPVKFCAVLSQVERIITKTGRAMLFAKAEDTSARIEVVVFPDLLERNPMVWQEGEIVIISGKVNNRNGNLAVVAEEAKLVEADKR